MRRRYEILILLFLLIPASVFSIVEVLTVSAGFHVEIWSVTGSLILLNPFFLFAYFAGILPTKTRLIILTIVEILSYYFALWVFANGSTSSDALPSMPGFSILIGIFPVAITVLCGYVLKSYGTSQRESSLQHRNQVGQFI